MRIKDLKNRVRNAVKDENIEVRLNTTRTYGANITEISCSNEYNSNFLIIKVDQRKLSANIDTSAKRIAKLLRWFEANVYDLQGDEIKYLKELKEHKSQMFYYSDVDTIPAAAYAIEALQLVEFEPVKDGGYIVGLTNAGFKAIKELENTNL